MIPDNVRESMEAVIGTHIEDSGRCAWCGQVDSHNTMCPVGEFIAILATIDAKPEGPTVRVRIAVEIDPDGIFGVACEDPGDEASRDSARRNLIYAHGGTLEGSRTVYVSASIPLPQPIEPVVVEGEVVT